MIDAILTLPEKSLELEVQRRITAINAVTVHCGVEEGTPSRHVWRGRPVKSNSPVYVAKPNVALCQAILFIKTNKRLIVYFYYIRNTSLLICNKVAKYITSSSSS